MRPKGADQAPGVTRSSSLPTVARLAEESGRLEVRILRRGENLDLMDAYLTGGTRSMPVIIVLDGAPFTSSLPWPRLPGSQRHRRVNPKPAGQESSTWPSYSRTGSGRTPTP